MIILKSKSLSKFEELDMNMVKSCLKDLVCGIFKLYPPYLNQIFGCSIFVPWEMGAEIYAHQQMDNIWLCHAAGSIAGALKDLTPDMKTSFDLDTTDLMYGCMCTLLRVHNALTTMLEIEAWRQVHGMWMANAKRFEFFFKAIK
jgi:hypothetical protein